MLTNSLNRFGKPWKLNPGKALVGELFTLLLCLLRWFKGMEPSMAPRSTSS